MKKWWTWVALALVVIVCGTVLLSVDLRPREEYVEDPAVMDQGLEEDTIPLPPSAYGIPLEGLVVMQDHLRSGATFGKLLSDKGVSMSVVNSLVEAGAGVFDVRRMRSGHPYAFLYTNDSLRTPRWFVYEADAVRYYLFALQEPYAVEEGRRPIVTEEHSVSITVGGALYNDLKAAGADPMLSLQLADIYAWTVDFHRIQKGDTFTVVYSQQQVDGERYGMPEVLAARYRSSGSVKQAFRLERADGGQYFDEEGNSLRKAFLKAPLKYSRISSGYSKRRLHPVQKVMKAHLGTDYAAPYGTPILSVGDGVVEKAGFTSGNGKFVKIRHNATYSTQYLHMRKILVKQGQRVQQGDVIGEVGSTGLATGPHVCFRFWKHGQQVDHRREEFPSAEPVAEEDRSRFTELMRGLGTRLDAVEAAPQSALAGR